MFKVFLTNFGWYINNGNGFPTLDEAKEAGRKAGFEFSVDTPNDGIVGFYRTFGGWYDLI